MTSPPEKHFVVVVSPGRSGQSSFAKILNLAFPHSYVAFEEPQIHYVLPKIFSNCERHFRRKFIETDELLGRGKVLKAFSRNKQTQLQSYALAKFDWISHKMHSNDTSLYFDVSKHFMHGLHVHLLTLMLPNVQIIELIRNPVANMRSFLNRNKDFYLDNGPTDCKFNQLKINPALLSKGQLYLHAWCECYLRSRKYASDNNINLHTVNTSDLMNSKKIYELLRKLEIPFKTVTSFTKINENVSQGFGKTIISEYDIEEVSKFCKLLPDEILAKIPEIKSSINGIT